MTSFRTLGKRKVSHFHPAMGGGISSLERAVETLFFANAVNSSVEQVCVFERKQSFKQFLLSAG